MAVSFFLDLWNKWNIRGFVVLSLSLQICLILFAPLRKKTANRPIIFLLWLAYLMADSVAAFAVGLISHNQGNLHARVAEVDGALQAFWASFLLLHLGGPDTITAFSLEDSSLWKRHLLSLIFQVGAAIYVFVRIFPSDKSLVIPTILVFLAGFIKIAERTLALYLSSFPKLRESMLLDNKPRMAADSSQLLEELIVHSDGYGCSDEEGAKLAESIVVKHAYSFFQIFKVFIADLIFTKQQREMSRKYFAKVSAVDALRLILVELDFIYEELHTKALTIRHRWSYIFRIIAFTSVAVALGLFNRLKKYRLLELDVKITHILLFGGIVLDGIALFMLVFSDWTVARIKYNTTGSSKLDSFLYKLVSATDYLRKPRYATSEVYPKANVTYEVFDTPLIFRRWSESISACNLFSEALKESPRKICKCNRFRGIIVFKNICSFPFRMVDKIISRFHQAGETIARCCGKRSMNAEYVSENLFIKKLWIFIFNDVKRRSENVDDPEWVRLTIKNRGITHLWGLDSPNVPKEHVNMANFHSMIILWHIVTEICYNTEKPTERNDEREFSKILSDYMLYLLLNQPNVMSGVTVVGIAQKRTVETLLELRRLIISDAPKDLAEICKKLYDEAAPRGRVAPRLANQSESLVKLGLSLVHRMEERVGEAKWNIMSGQWVEMLQHAAVNIKGEAHVQVLSKGGELLAFVWLLMAHFGCFYRAEWGMYYEFWDEMSKHRPARAI
ncbi:uncharacterized protein LOC115664637 [Syzygium oleosum]|uniref:uncharacterized protein LOC115664637 n=1 Tax=Syzygium oleosum TaxID=219896 RepID=UPI0011D1819F|nr:uncharacterized protein LOC115664637 [Syzygium oleosum]